MCVGSKPHIIFVFECGLWIMVVAVKEGSVPCIIVFYLDVGGLLWRLSEIGLEYFLTCLATNDRRVLLMWL
jgi:hypothetical protein